MRFSPTLFLVLQFFILFPSVLFILGVFFTFFAKDATVYNLVISKNILQNIGVLIISPLASGFVAYHYLERYRPEGFVELVSKYLLGYTIIILGSTIIFLFLNFFSSIS